MTLVSGTRLGPYEIVAQIGQGGMGEVYRARDTRLERSVAIKTLPAELAQNAAFKLRFDREAKTISQLEHPHICRIYDVGEESATGQSSVGAPPVHYLVMELLEGESLADRLARGPLPVADVLRFGAQIAEALDRAHRAGIVHRDLKPGNVMITKGGAKLLDFGLARATGIFTAAGSQPAATQETMARPLTEEGTIVGTVQYMAPEQIEGAAVDARTDIFAFGALLYEMVTGRRAFEGKSRASLIASILDRDPPPIATLQPLSPPALDRIISTCLQKNPDDRWQTAHDLVLQLKWLAEGGSMAGVAAPVAARRRHRERAAWIATALAVVAALAFAGLWIRERVFHRPSVVTSSIVPPDGLHFVTEERIVISPDGSRVAFVGESGDSSRIYVRRLSDGNVSALTGTDGAEQIFWSPDSRHLAFFAQDKLKRIPATGGPPQTICDARNPRGGTWGGNGSIVFALFRSGLFQVPSGGGTPVPVTRVDTAHGELNHRWPEFLPDQKHLLFLAQRAEGGAPDDPSTIEVLTLGSGERKALVRANSSVLFSPEGHILYWRGKSMLAQQFDTRSLAVAGDADPVADDVGYSGTEEMMASISNNATLVYIASAQRIATRLVWVDRTGRETGEVDAPAAHEGPAVSPDGTRVAFSLTEETEDIWVSELPRNTKRRMTTDSADEFGPVWSPDGRTIVYASNRPPMGLWTMPAGGGTPHRLTLADNPAPTDWSPENEILYDVNDPKLKYGVAIVNARDGKSRILIQGPSNEKGARFSPDRKWVAYFSDESGRPEVYALNLATGEHFQVSTNGGAVPRWSHDGKTIYYLGPANTFTSVAVTTTPHFSAAEPVALFPVMVSLSRDYPYCIGKDDRFLFNMKRASETTLPATMIQNWRASD